MNRRHFLRHVSVSLAAAALAPRVFSVASTTNAQHLAADVATPPAVPPGGQILYFGWEAAPIVLGAEAPLVLRWPTGTAAEKATRLRIAVAQFMRSTCKIEATLAGFFTFFDGLPNADGCTGFDFWQYCFVDHDGDEK